MPAVMHSLGVPSRLGSVRFRWFENPMETYQIDGFWKEKFQVPWDQKCKDLPPNFFWRFKWLQLLGLLKAFSIHVGRPKGLRNHLAHMEGSKLRGRSWLQHPAKSSIRWVFWGHKKKCVCVKTYIYIYYPKVQKRYRVSIVDFGAIRSFPPHGFESTHLNLQPRSFQPTSTSYDVRSLQHSSDQHFQSFRPPGHHVGIRQFLLKDRVWPIFGGGDHKVVTFQEFWKAKRTRHRAQPENPKRKKTKTSK